MEPFFFATRSSLAIMIYHVYIYIYMIHTHTHIYIYTYVIYLVSPRSETKQRRLEVQFLGEPFGSPQLGLSQRFEHGLLCGEAAGQGDGWPLNEEKIKTPG